MISHRDLLRLAGLADYFPLIGDYLRGATIEVQFETDEGGQNRTHIIVDAVRFPMIAIAAEGSDISPVVRPFFGLPEMYQVGDWELVTRDVDRSLRDLIDHRRIDTEAARRAGQVELARRIKLRDNEEREAARLMTAALRQEARKRLLAVQKPPFRDVRWRLILGDLNMVVADISREGDRRFIADVSQHGLFSDRQFAWVMDIFDRTVRSIRSSRFARTG